MAEAVWADGSNTLSCSWDTTCRVVSDGSGKVHLAAQPVGEGEGVLAVEARRVAAGGTVAEPVELRFDADTGKLVGVYTTEDPVGEVRPDAGDSFRFIARAVDLSDPADPKVTEAVAGSLVFGPAGFTLAEDRRPGGTYTVGLLVSDLSGNEAVQVYTVTVTN